MTNAPATSSNSFGQRPTALFEAHLRRLVNERGWTLEQLTSVGTDFHVTLQTGHADIWLFIGCTVETARNTRSIPTQTVLPMWCRVDTADETDEPIRWAYQVWNTSEVSRLQVMQTRRGHALVAVFEDGILGDLRETLHGPRAAFQQDEYVAQAGASEVIRQIEIVLRLESGVPLKNAIPGMTDWEPFVWHEAQKPIKLKPDIHHDLPIMKPARPIGRDRLLGNKYLPSNAILPLMLAGAVTVGLSVMFSRFLPDGYGFVGWLVLQAPYWLLYYMLVHHGRDRESAPLTLPTQTHTPNLPDTPGAASLQPQSQGSSPYRQGPVQQRAMPEESSEQQALDRLLPPFIREAVQDGKQLRSVKYDPHQIFHKLRLPARFSAGGPWVLVDATVRIDRLSLLADDDSGRWPISFTLHSHEVSSGDHTVDPMAILVPSKWYAVELWKGNDYLTLPDGLLVESVPVVAGEEQKRGYLIVERDWQGGWLERLLGA